MENKKLQFKEYFLDSNYGLLWLSLGATIFYVLCATPATGWRDGPELVVTATFLDVAHPAGFPTYNLLAKIITWLPFGALGFRVTMFSALASGAAVFLLGLLLKKIHRLESEIPQAPFWLLVPLLFFILYQGFWAASVEVEVYSLNVLFVVGLLYCATSWYEGRGLIWLYFGGLLYGLACGNHASLALYLPVLLLLTFLGNPPKSPTSGPVHPPLVRLITLIVIFLIGLSVYLLLYVRSQTDSLPVDFGRPNNLERFWLHVSDAKDSEYHTKSLLDISQMFYYLGLQIKNLTSSLFLLALPFIFWGLHYLWRRYQIMSVALVVLVLINMVFFFYWIDGTSAFLPTVLVSFILLSLGLGQFGRMLNKVKLPSVVGSLVSVLVVVSALFFLGYQRWVERESEAGFMSTEFFWPDLVNLPPESVVVHNNNWFAQLALAYVYSFRADVSLINAPAILYPIANPYPTPRKFPMAVFPKGSDGALLSPYVPRYFDHFFSSNLEANKPVFFQFSEAKELPFEYVVPDTDFLWYGRLTFEPKAAFKAYQEGKYNQFIENAIAYINFIAVNNDPPLARKAPAYIFYIVRPVLDFVIPKDGSVLGEKFARTYLNTFTDFKGRLLAPFDVHLNMLGVLAYSLKLQGRYEEELEVLKKIISMDPTKAQIYYLLALSAQQAGKPELALDSARRAMEKDPYEIKFIYNLALLIAKNNSIQQAVDFLTERANFLQNEDLLSSIKYILYLRECLLLDPELENLPEVDPVTLFQSATVGP